MQSSQERVASIFQTAGEAFQRLGDLTGQLSTASSTPNGGQEQNNKWTDEEVKLLAAAVNNFANDLANISERIKARTVGQITNALKKKAFLQAGIDEQEQEQQEQQIEQQQPQQSPVQHEQIEEQQQPPQQQQQPEEPTLDDDGIDFDS